MEPAWEGVGGEGRDCIFIGECAWNATDRALITSQAILSIDRFAVWSFEPGLSGGRHRPKEGVVGKGGERTGVGGCVTSAVGMCKNWRTMEL